MRGLKRWSRSRSRGVAREDSQMVFPGPVLRSSKTRPVDLTRLSRLRFSSSRSSHHTRRTALSNVSSFCCAASPLTSAQRFTYFFGVSSNGLLGGTPPTGGACSAALYDSAEATQDPCQPAGDWLPKPKSEIKLPPCLSSSVYRSAKRAF
jgi:hypothetical protein